MKLIAEVKFTDRLSTIKVSTDTDVVEVKVEDWDEWNAITLDGVLYDIAFYVDDCTTSITLYELSEKDADGNRQTLTDKMHPCTIVGDIVNDAMAWGEIWDDVIVKPHGDIRYEFLGTIVSFKNDPTHKVIAIEDLCGEVWDCESKYIVLRK